MKDTLQQLAIAMVALRKIGFNTDSATKLSYMHRPEIKAVARKALRDIRKIGKREDVLAPPFSSWTYQDILRECAEQEEP